MQEKQILGMITSEASWEQVIYQIVAWEGLDPWDLDLMVLTKGFMNYLKKLDEMDFKVPAKYLMVATMLLRMKSDHLRLMEIVDASEVCEVPELEEFELDPDHLDEELEERAAIEVNPITVPPKRLARKKVVVDDLVAALRRTLRAQERRELRKTGRKKRIKISREDITKKINSLYEKINGLLSEMEKEEVEFSRVVGKWERKNIVENFLPMIHLDNQKKIDARQEEAFNEIFIKKGKEK